MINLRASISGVSFGSPSVQLQARQDKNARLFETLGLNDETIVLTVTSASDANEPRKNTLWSKSAKDAVGYFAVYSEGSIHHLGLELEQREFDALRHHAAAYLSASRLLDVEVQFDVQIEREDETGRTWKVLGSSRIYVRNI